MSAPRDRWYDREAGPVVRPYAVTKGRTMPASDSYVGLIDMVIAISKLISREWHVRCEPDQLSIRIA